jgi:predicted alpha-1,2-mannosidase
MKLQVVCVIAIIAGGLCSVAGCSSDSNDSETEQITVELQDLLIYVNPLIGSSGSGNVIPGALVPHGMIRLSPSSNLSAGSIGGYDYLADRIDGFTHTQLEGPGGSANGYSQLLFMPLIGDVSTSRDGYSSAFSHDKEIAKAGYYSVMLDDYDVKVELTASSNAGIHRYTFPQSDVAKILIDLGYSRGITKKSYIEIVDDTTIEGYARYIVHPLLNMVPGSEDDSIAESTVYFYARFDRPFESFGVWKGGTVMENETVATDQVVGAFVGYSTDAGQQIEVRVGISFIDVDHARISYQNQVQNKSFEQVREKTEIQWNTMLNRIQIEGGDDEKKKTFYTALYHSLFQPADYTESDGSFFCGADGVGDTYTAHNWRYFTDDWCMWDTYRTSHPLGTLVEPEIRSDIVRSMLHWYTVGGWLPKCTWNATGYSRVMIGNHAIPIIVDAFVKGLDDFDATLAYEAILKASMNDNENFTSEGMCGYLNLGTIPDYIEKGYVPHECDATQAASMTLEYAYNDWCVAVMADALQDSSTAESFYSRALNFENHWNPGSGFMQPKMADGSWFDPFDPVDDSEFNGFCEASSWIYSFFVPHDVERLIELMGGPESFVERLDQYFDDGYHDMSNQPGFHIPFLYNFAGRPELTQQRVNQLLVDNFNATESGLPGNDDSGAMSAWYVLAAAGLYPVAPGSPEYQLSTPMFERIVLHLNKEYYSGQTFTIATYGTGVTITSTVLNGETLNRNWITHDEITAGGTLDVYLNDL